jgi:hypothetical protein
MFTGGTSNKASSLEVTNAWTTVFVKSVTISSKQMQGVAKKYYTFYKLKQWGFAQMTMEIYRM